MVTFPLYEAAPPPEEGGLNAMFSTHSTGCPVCPGGSVKGIVAQVVPLAVSVTKDGRVNVVTGSATGPVFDIVTD